MILAAGSLLSQVALIVAMSLFVGIIVWLWVTPRARWRNDAQIPLSDEPIEPRDASTTPHSPARDDKETRR